MARPWRRRGSWSISGHWFEGGQLALPLPFPPDRDGREAVDEAIGQAHDRPCPWPPRRCRFAPRAPAGGMVLGLIALTARESARADDSGPVFEEAAYVFDLDVGCVGDSVNSSRGTTEASDHFMSSMASAGPGRCSENEEARAVQRVSDTHGRTWRGHPEHHVPSAPNLAACLHSISGARQSQDVVVGCPSRQ